MITQFRNAGLVLLALLAGAGLKAQTISRHDVLAAIAVLENDITGPGALQAAVTVTRFGRESNDVLLIIGPETLPWVRTEVSESDARIRALLMAAYFGGDIKSQLQKGRPDDDPYRGWLAAIRAYRQIQKKEPGVSVPEMDELIRQERAGTLRQRAEDLLKQQKNEAQPPGDFI